MKRVGNFAVGALAILLNVVAVFGIVCSVLAISHGNFKWLFVLVLGLLLLLVSDRVYKASERK